MGYETQEVNKTYKVSEKKEASKGQKDPQSNKIHRVSSQAHLKL